MSTTILAPIVLCVLGIIFGIILAVASKVFAVEKDPREEAITECLPGANCGGCGYPGCGGYANAVVKGLAPVDACSPGGAEVAKKIGAIMGVEVEEGARKIAQVMCTGGGHDKTRYDYVGLESCLAISRVSSGPLQCSYGCLGGGDCVEACKFDAIHIVDNVAKLEDSMAHFMPELPSNIAAPLCSILLIFLLDWRMGLAALVTIPLGTLFFAAMMRGYGPRMENYMRSANEMNSALVEYVNGIQVIKAFNRSAASYGKYADSVRYFHDSTMAWWSQCWLWNAAARAVLPSTLLGTLPVGAWLYMEGSLSLHVFLVALVVPLGFIAPLMKVSAAMEQVSMIKGNLEQVTTFLKTPKLVRPTEPAKLGERCYQFEDVHFAYNESEVLHGISFQTQPGTMTAIVGPSGSGKSTIAKLMAGFWDVTSGTVRFGGQDIRNIPFGQLMGEISYVAQDNFLFDKSIRENIRMGNPDASDEEVEAAAKAANCHDFIMQLEQGYDTMAGDAGARLSGGERQRITIARADRKSVV